MLRSLKSRILLDAQGAIAQVKQFGERMGNAKEVIGKVQGRVGELAVRSTEATKRISEAFKRIGPVIQKQMETIIKYRNWFIAIGTAAKVALGAFLREAIQGERIMTIFNTLFAEGRDDVRQWAQTLVRSTGYGLSTILHGLNLVQSYMLSFGMARDSAAQASQRVVELATNIALLRGERFEDAINTITRALAGQTRGLVSLGIAVDQAVLNEAARTLGYRKSFNALTQVQRAEVALVAIEEAHSRSLAELGDGVDLAAVAQTRLTESTKELGEALGTAWLNPFKRAANAVSRLMMAIADNQPLVTFLSLFIGIGGIVATTIGVLGTFARHLVYMKNFSKDFPRLGKLFEWPGRALKWTIGLIHGKIKAWGIWVATRVKSLIPLLAAEVAEQRAKLRSIFIQEAHNTSMRIGYWAKMKAAGAAVWLAGKKTALAFASGVATAAQWLYNKALWASPFAIAAAGAVVLAAKKVALAIASGVATAAQWALNAALYACPLVWILGIIVAVIAAIGGLAYGIYRLVQHLGGFRETIRKIGDAFKALGGWIGSLFGLLRRFGIRTGEMLSSTAKTVAGFFSGLASRTRTFFGRVWDDLISGLRTAISFVHVLMNRWVRVVLSALQQAFGWVPWLGNRITEMMRDFDPLQLMIQNMRKSNRALAREAELIANTIRNSRPDLSGKELMDEFVRSFKMARPELWEEVQKFVEPIALQLETGSPPKMGPLREIDKWGESLGNEYAAGFVRSSERLLRVLPRRLPIPTVQIPPAIGETARALAEHPHSPINVKAALDTDAILARLAILPEINFPAFPQIVPQITVPTVRVPAPPYPLQPAPRGRKPRAITGPPIEAPRIELSIQVGGVTVNAHREMTRDEAKVLGEEAGAGISAKIKSEVSKYLLEVLSAGESLLMPDEME